MSPEEAHGGKPLAMFRHGRLVERLNSLAKGSSSFVMLFLDHSEWTIEPSSRSKLVMFVVALAFETRTRSTFVNVTKMPLLYSQKLLYRAVRRCCTEFRTQHRCLVAQIFGCVLMHASNVDEKENVSDKE